VQEIERARDQALDDLFAHMGRCVSQATEQVIGRSLTGPDHERLIEEALKGFAHRQN
jgi:F-type H+-transporting ATPase subunit b